MDMKSFKYGFRRNYNCMTSTTNVCKALSTKKFSKQIKITSDAICDNKFAKLCSNVLKYDNIFIIYIRQEHPRGNEKAYTKIASIRYPTTA